MKYLSILLIAFLSLNSHAQSDQFKLSLAEALDALAKEKDVRIYYSKDYLSTDQVSINLELSVEANLGILLAQSGLSYLNYRDYVYIIAPKDQLERNYDLNYYVNKRTLAKSNTKIIDEQASISVGSSESKGLVNGLAKVSGFINDDSNDEILIGVTIQVKETGEGTTTNTIGQYILNLGVGEYTLVLNSVGYIEREVLLKVLGSGPLDLKLSKQAIQLNEVIVSAKSLNENITRNEAGLESLSGAAIKKLPAFLGEVDVVKSLLLLPGVSTVGEGSGGFNVRGGTVDQNLIMQDGLFLFNSSHVLGLFSLFNPDLVKNVNLYKGSIPAQYGGRLSSVLNVELKDGNFQQWTGKGGLGFISSRLAIEGPLVRGKTSLLFGLRSSYSDWLFNLVNIADLKASKAFFYDSNVKLTHRFGNKGGFDVGAYTSKDRFKYSEEFDFSWETLGFNAHMNYLLSERVAFKMQAVYSNYKSKWNEPEASRAFELKGGIDYYNIKPELSLDIAGNNHVIVGAEFNDYTTKPGSITPTGASSNTVEAKLPDERGRELSVFINDELNLSDELSISLGLRYTIYQSLGPAIVRNYEANTIQSDETATGTDEFGDGEVIKSYNGLEPRFSLRYALNNSSSIKMSYNRSQQFISQISNTTAVSPVDIWQLSNHHIEPQRASSYSIGIFKNLNNDLWETSFEVFYRDIDNLIEYKDLANLLVQPNIETELLSGIGRSYGAEVSIKKKAGRWNGWLGYTYSRTERKTQSEFLDESISNNEWFLSNYDKPHDMSLALSYQMNKRNYFSMNFVYSSGRPITAPVGKFSVDNVVNIPFYSARNSFRIPDYHRLDISYTIEQSHLRNQKWRSSWTFSVYNVYGRKNAYTVFFTQAPSQDPKAFRLAILGSAFPAVTYNFNF